MSGATAPLLIQALREMVQYYEREELKHHLIRFRDMLQRTKTMARQDKRLVEEELLMLREYDFFIDENPLVKKRMAKKLKEGEAKGVRKSILTIIKLRYPSLEALAKQKLGKVGDIEKLNAVLSQVATASSEADVRQVLDPPVA